MIIFTDGDVAAILRAIMNSNRTGVHRQPLGAMITVGMPDSVYDAAYAYAVRSGMIRITGQANEVTRAGRRYMRSATVPATHERRARPSGTVVDQDLDAGSMTVKSLSDLETEWLLSDPDPDPNAMDGMDA